VRNHLGHHRLTISLNFCFYFAFNCRSPRFACHRAQFPKKKKKPKKNKGNKEEKSLSQNGKLAIRFCLCFLLHFFISIAIRLSGESIAMRGVPKFRIYY